MVIVRRCREAFMADKRLVKFKKYNMICWCVIGAVSFVVIILTLLSRARVFDIRFNPVIGIVIPLFAGLGALAQITAYFKENKLVYAQAKEEEKEEIMEIFSAVKDDMAALGIDQWDGNYPGITDITKDIKNGEMYTVRQGGRLTAVYTLNTQEENAYKFGAFKDKSGGYRVLHRFCVHPEYQHMGMAFGILGHIETAAKKEGISSIRLDVFTKNPRAMELYKRAGYTYAGDAYFRKGKFHLMEKLL